MQKSSKRQSKMGYCVLVSMFHAGMSQSRSAVGMHESGFGKTTTPAIASRSNTLISTHPSWLCSYIS